MYLTFATPGNDARPGQVGGIIADLSGPAPDLTAVFFATVPLQYLEPFACWADTVAARYLAGDHVGWQTNSRGNDFLIIELGEVIDVPDRVPAEWLREA